MDVKSLIETDFSPQVVVDFSPRMGRRKVRFYHDGCEVTDRDRL